MNLVRPLAIAMLATMLPTFGQGWFTRHDSKRTLENLRKKSDLWLTTFEHYTKELARLNPALFWSAT